MLQIVTTPNADANQMLGGDEELEEESSEEDNENEADEDEEDSLMDE